VDIEAAAGAEFDAFVEIHAGAEDVALGVEEDAAGGGVGSRIVEGLEEFAAHLDAQGIALLNAGHGDAADAALLVNL
jgi:GNAT superfamily N-acetyltransferase